MKILLNASPIWTYNPARTALILGIFSVIPLLATIHIQALEEIKSPAHFEKVRDKHPLLAIKFYSPKCGACKKIAPFVEKLSQEYPDVHFVAVNDDDDSLDPIEHQYDINLVPKLVFIGAKTGTHEFYGANLEKLRETFKPLIEAESLSRKPAKTRSKK